MKTHLIKSASEVIPNQMMLVNVISRRVRQLARGHRPLVACAPGTGLSDVALTEVIEGKLSFEAAPVLKAGEEEPAVIPFPVKDSPRKKAA